MRFLEPDLDFPREAARPREDARPREGARDEPGRAAPIASMYARRTAEFAVREEGPCPNTGVTIG